MRHKDRNRIQVPANLPNWMDGPAIRRAAKKWGISYDAAKKRILRHFKSLPQGRMKKR